jgi:hypothetical protein
MRTLHLIAVACLIASESIAQKNENVIAIVNDPSQANANVWMNISEVSPKSGVAGKSLFEANRTSYALYDGASNVKIGFDAGTGNQSPTATMVAAAAYDVKTNRLFLTPMYLSELRWIDLDDRNTTLKAYTIPFTSLSSQDLSNPANHVTRMTMNADGYGYALTNDANHLIRFSTGKKVVVTDLGPVNDADNQPVSIHSKCTSFGGDMIADKAGNLYVISAYKAIFRVNVSTRTSVYLGNIKGLPDNYTTNGAAVTADGDLIVSSATSNEGYYKVDMNKWEASKVTGDNKVVATSDLASAYFAFDKKTAPAGRTGFPSVFSNVTVYPNPATEGLVRISFDSKEAGRFNVQLVDITGRAVIEKAIVVTNQKQLVELEIASAVSKGTYLVNIKNAKGESVYSDKLMVE